MDTVSIDLSFKVYLLAKCFVSVVYVAITAGIGLHNLLKIVAPEFTLDAYSYIDPAKAVLVNRYRTPSIETARI
jgi:hypothetical protein